MDTLVCGEYHDSDEKTVLGQTIPAGLTPEQDVKAALDILFNHDNAAPFFALHMIKHFVTSNPAPAYVQRVAEAFIDNGQGVRGDMKAIIKAVLLDEEARNYNENDPAIGKGKGHILAFMQLMRMLNPEPLTIEGTNGKAYSFAYMTEQLKQMPIDSDTVFNFFLPDYVPNDPNFRDNDLIAPEFHLRDDQFLVKFHNLVLRVIRYEKSKGNTPSFQYKYHPEPYFSTDFTALLQLFEQELDGDTNGDYLNFDDDAKRTAAATKLVDHLALYLTTNGISEEQKTLIVDEVTSGRKEYSNTAYNLVRDVVHIIGTLNLQLAQL